MADGTVRIGSEFDRSGLEKGLSGLGSFAKQGFSAMGSAAAGFAKVTTAAVGAVASGIAAAGTAAIAVGKEFETSFAKASTLFGDVSVDTDGLKQKLLEVSDATGITASELNESLYSALSAGIPATEDMSEATAFLESSAKLAKAGFTDMDTALSATAKTLNAYGLDTSEADRIQKILIQTQNKGITTVDELGASLSQVTPTAAAFGVSFENVGAALSNMTAAGTPTAQATTQLNALIAELGKSGTQGAKSLEKAAKGTEYAGMGFKEMMDAGVPLNKVLDLVNQSAEDSGLSMVDMFSSIEAGKAALAIAGENSEKFSSNLEAMGTSADVVTEAYDKVSDTLENKVSKMANSAKNLGIQVYNGIQEPLKGLADVGIGYLDQLADALATGGVEGLANTGASIVSEIAMGITAQLPGLIDVASGFLTALMNGIILNLPQLITAGGQIVASLTTAVLSLGGQLLTIGGQLLSGIVRGLISNMPAIAAGANGVITELGSGLQNGLPQIIAMAGELISSLASGIGAVLPTLVPVAAEAIFALVNGLISNVGLIVDAGISLLDGLAAGLINAIPTIIEQAPVVITNLCTAFANNLPKIIAAGVEILIKLAAGIIQAIPQLVASLPQIFTAIVTAFKTFSFAEIGRNIIDGIKQGVANAAGLLIDAVKDVAEKALNGLKKFLGIHSPSRVFRDEIGKNIAVGIADGITQNKEYAEKSLEEVASAILQAAKKKLANEEVYRELSLVDEVAYWDSVRRQVGEGTQARIDADKEYLAKKKSLSQKMASIEQDYTDRVKKAHEDLAKSIQSLRDDYADELTSRTQDIMGSMGLFDEFTATTELSTEDLIGNLQGQVAGLRDWSDNLKNLERRGVTGSMLDELRGMGTDAAGEVALMTQMTNEQLDEYISLWKEKQRAARKEAKRELEPMLEDTENQISQLRAQTERELAAYKQEYVDAMAEIGVGIQQPLQQIQSSLLSTVSQAVALVAGTVSGEAGKEDNVSHFAELANSVLNASSGLPQEFAALGQDTVSGMIQGIQDKSSELCTAMAAVIRQAVQAARDEAQIHSPSRLMRDMIGRNMIAGVGVGFELEADSLETDARNIIKGTVSAMRRESAKGFVAAMQMQPIRAAAGVDCPDNYRSWGDSNGGGDSASTVIIKKGSFEVPVVLEGKEVARASAPYMDTELGTMADGKERGG